MTSVFPGSRTPDAMDPAGQQYAAEQHRSLGYPSALNKAYRNPDLDVKQNPRSIADEFQAHPLYDVFLQAFQQATGGKGARHGGDRTPFYRQQWVTLANHHGVGFLTGQATKKLNEAAHRVEHPELSSEIAKPGDAAWNREVLGALVYAGMAYLHANELVPK